MSAGLLKLSVVGEAYLWPQKNVRGLPRGVSADKTTERTSTP